MKPEDVAEIERAAAALDAPEPTFDEQLRLVVFATVFAVVAWTGLALWPWVHRR